MKPLRLLLTAAAVAGLISEGAHADGPHGDGSAARRSEAPSPEASGPGVLLHFRPIAGEELLAFATSFFYEHYPSPPNWSFGSRYSKHENWTTVTRAHGFAATVDLSGKGSDDLVLMVDSTDWCDDQGCLGAIFRPDQIGFEYICAAALEPKDTRLLAQMENGYRLIETQTTIVHWYAQQDFDSGTLCDSESRGP